jgi:hypothetical protein
MAATGGYDEEWAEKVKSSLKCGLCTLVLRDPEEVACGHFYCQPCMRKLRNRDIDER